MMFGHLHDAANRRMVVHMHDSKNPEPAAPFMLNLLETVVVSGASVSFIETSLKRLELKTDYMEAGRGHTRFFSRENVIELAIIARLVKARFTPLVAAERAGEIIELLREGVSEPLFIVFGGDEDSALSVGPLDRKLTAEQIAELSESGTVYVIIDVAKIVKKVDYLANHYSKKKTGRKAAS
jgi:hypothetical protein